MFRFGAATSVFEVFALGLRRAQNRDNRRYRIEHHVTPDIQIRIFYAVDAQDLPGNNGDQTAAVNLCDLIARTGARGAVVGREILCVEGGNGALARPNTNPNPNSVESVMAK